MDDSILNSIKKLLGPTEIYDNFDSDIITHINTAIFELNQIGIGPVEGFSIKDDEAVWKEYLPDDKNHEAVKTYIYYSVKLAFDPPSSSTLLQSMERQMDKLAWRLNVLAESNIKGGTNE